MYKFNVGDEVKCKPKTDFDEYPGAGWEEGKVFIIGKRRGENSQPCYFPTSESGVYEPWLELNFTTWKDRYKKNGR